MADDSQIALSGVNQRAVLGYMLLNANRTVATSELIRALWSEDAPPTSRKMVQNALAKLRRTLCKSRDWGKSILISTRPPGYFLRVPPESIDLYGFQQMVDQGRNELASRRFDNASMTLHAALAAWRGPALSDLVESGIVWPQITALDEARLDVFEDCVDADLALGRHRQLASGLEPILDTEPARERLCGQLMLALYRCGRQREALRLYRRTQLALAERFGLDPGRELQELEQAILNHDPALAWAETVPSLAYAMPGTERVAFPAGAVESTPQRVPYPSSATGSVVERKRISVLLVQAQLAPAHGVDDLEHFDASLKALSSVIDTATERFGGMIWATIGSSWCVIFGIPHARKDDPERAVRTALAIQNEFALALEVRQLPGTADMAIKAAIATGEAMVTYQSSDDNRVTAVTGDVIDGCQELLSTVPSGEVRICATRPR